MSWVTASVHRQRGSVRLALLSALCGAAAVLIWSVVQERQIARPIGTASPSQVDTAAHSTAAAVPRPTRLEGTPPVPPPLPAIGATSAAAPPTDPDGLPPDYAALIDDFQQQRAREPLVDD
jgi:hypothetical protein